MDQAKIAALLGDEREQYSCLAVSTSHIKESDAKMLQHLADSEPNVCDMIMARESGFFIKLYEEEDEYLDDPEYEHLNYYSTLSHEANALIELAYRAGYRLIELDCDARRYPNLPMFEW
jgi:hypothetical protein